MGVSKNLLTKAGLRRIIMAAKKTNSGTAAKKTSAKPHADETGITAKIESFSQVLAKKKKRAGKTGVELFFIELLENFLAVIIQYTVVKGRSSRREFWMFVLAVIIIGFIFGILTAIPLLGIFVGIASFLFGIVTIIPSITVGVRRLHDTNKTGWLMLLILIPLLGGIAVLVLCAFKGTHGRNQYGSAPI
jgi:uncharacterized membrane protein YhaH (DUF805 family)